MRKLYLYLIIPLIFSQCRNEQESPTPLAKNRGKEYHFSSPDNNPFKESEKTVLSDLKHHEESKFQYNTHKKVRRITVSSRYKQPRFADTIFFKRLSLIQKGNTDLDFSEPSTREYLLNPVNNTNFRSLITLSRDRLLKINFDNDILDYTDRFYTNGIKFELISPAMHDNPLTYLMLPNLLGGMNYYGITLVQNMYTPSTTKADKILFGDRPYSAYLYFGTFKISNDRERKFRQTSEMDIGVIGPASLGEYIQKSFHNEVPTNGEPLGWEYQIKNDLVINYRLFFEKGIFNNNRFDLIANGTGNLGTLYTNLSAGLLFRAGILNPYFTNLGISKKAKNRASGQRNFQFLCQLSINNKLIGYDATLQGGFFNKSSVYSIRDIAVSRYTLQGTAGISIAYNGFRLDLDQFFLSPEFHNGWWHKWVHIALTFAI